MSAQGRRRPGGQAQLADLLSPLLGRLGLGTRIKQQLIAALWPELVGPIAARHSWAETVREGVLVIGADTHAWAQELDLRRGELLERIEARVGPSVIRDLRFRGGRTRPPSSDRFDHPRKTSRPQELSPTWRQAIEEALEEIGQEEIRARLRSALTSLAGGTQGRREEGWKRCLRCGRLHRRPRQLCASCARWAPPRRR